MLLSCFQQELREAGCDEAGRGCLAGPVFAAAVMLPEGFSHPLLNDSKQVNARDRNLLREVIERSALAFAVASIDNEEIDRINILKASFKAMHLALDRLPRRPELILVDGNRFVPYRKIPYRCFVKGDARFTAIAAASILAKTYRDEHMMQLHEEFPHYHWQQNKGYGTEAHCRAIEQYGQCKYHRRTFRLKAAQPDLFQG